MKVSIRTCIACRKKDEKNNFFRVTRSPNGRIFWDKSYKSDGRSAYVCRDYKCVETVLKKRSLNYAFKINVSQAIYESVCNDIKSALDNSQFD